MSKFSARRKYVIWDRPVKSSSGSYNKPHPIKPKKAKFWVYRNTDGEYYYAEAKKSSADRFHGFVFRDAEDAYNRVQELNQKNRE